MEIRVTKTSVYIPEWNGNKAEADPVRITYKTPTLDDRRRLIPQPRMSFKIGVDGKPAGGEVDVTVDTRAFVESLVEKVEGLTITDENGNSREIRTARDLLAAPASIAGLVEEIGKEIQAATNGRTEDEKKS